MRHALYAFYRRSQRVIVPTLRSSQYAYYEALRDVVNPGSRWCDLGCGHQVFAQWMTREQDEIIARTSLAAGIDLDWDGLRKHRGIRHRVYGTLESLPFPPGTFDVVSANMVMEHIADPSKVLREVYQVLAPGGSFIFHTANFHHWGTLVARQLPERLKKRLVWFFEGRNEEDVFRTYYRVNTPEAAKTAAERTGFNVAAITLVSSVATLQMLGPVAWLELLYIRAVQRASLARLRSNLIVVLRKPPSS